MVRIRMHYDEQTLRENGRRLAAFTPSYLSRYTLFTDCVFLRWAKSPKPAAFAGCMTISLKHTLIIMG
jgi:hypothetical protein